MESMVNAGINCTQEKWFTNLTYVGNVGAASIYIMLEELFHSGKLKNGEKIYLFIPESGRFSYTTALLTVVKTMCNTIRYIIKFYRPFIKIQ